MASVTIYDAEFLTAPGAPQRFWCGPRDPDPLTIQIGAVRLSLTPPYDISAPQSWYVVPRDRDGGIVAVDPLVTQIMGITDAVLAEQGVPLADALQELDRFSQGDTLLAWGKDELLTFAASLFVQGVQSPIAPIRFRNAVPLLVEAGEPAPIVETLRSNTLCAHLGVLDPGRAHDAAGDALSVATALQHLLWHNRLTEKHFAALAPANTPEQGT